MFKLSITLFRLVADVRQAESNEMENPFDWMIFGERNFYCFVFLMFLILQIVNQLNRTIKYL